MNNGVMNFTVGPTYYLWPDGIFRKLKPPQLKNESIHEATVTNVDVEKGIITIKTK